MNRVVPNGLPSGRSRSYRVVRRQDFAAMGHCAMLVKEAVRWRQNRRLFFTKSSSSAAPDDSLQVVLELKEMERVSPPPTSSRAEQIWLTKRSFAQHIQRAMPRAPRRSGSRKASGSRREY